MWFFSLPLILIRRSTIDVSKFSRFFYQLILWLSWCDRCDVRWALWRNIERRLKCFCNWSWQYINIFSTTTRNKTQCRRNLLRPGPSIVHSRETAGIPYLCQFSSEKKRKKPLYGKSMPCPFSWEPILYIYFLRVLLCEYHRPNHSCFLMGSYYNKGQVIAFEQVTGTHTDCRSDASPFPHQVTVTSTLLLTAPRLN